VGFVTVGGQFGVGQCESPMVIFVAMYIYVPYSAYIVDYLTRQYAPVHLSPLDGVYLKRIMHCCLAYESTE